MYCMRAFSSLEIVVRSPVHNASRWSAAAALVTPQQLTTRSYPATCSRVRRCNACCAAAGGWQRTPRDTACTRISGFMAASVAALACATLCNVAHRPPGRMYGVSME
jgi:hypothetical protein